MTKLTGVMEKTAIRPFRFEAADAELDKLRRRTRKPWSGWQTHPLPLPPG